LWGDSGNRNNGWGGKTQKTATFWGTQVQGGPGKGWGGWVGLRGVTKRGDQPAGKPESIVRDLVWG